MTGNLDAATAKLERRFLLDFPWEAARRIETLPTAETAPTLVRQPARFWPPCGACCCRKRRRGC